MELISRYIFLGVQDQYTRNEIVPIYQEGQMVNVAATLTHGFGSIRAKLNPDDVGFLLIACTRRESGNVKLHTYDCIRIYLLTPNRCPSIVREYILLWASSSAKDPGCFSSRDTAP